MTPRAPRTYTLKLDDPLATGHDLVDAIGCVALQGFLIDPNWRCHPLLQSETTKADGKGKANLSYQLVWAYLVDRYRPIKMRDAETGVTTCITKFPGDYFTTTYAKLARELGLASSQVRQAIKLFDRRGLVEKRPAPDARHDDKNEKPFEVWPMPDMVLEVTGRGNFPVELETTLLSRNWVCDRLLQIQFKGDVIDYTWLGHRLLQNDAGKTNALIVIVLAHLFFLHTPTDNYDPITHEPLRRTKKFDNDRLYKSYRSWARTFGLTDDQLRSAVAFLNSKGIITREIAPIIDRSNEPTNNKVIIELSLEKILELTYGTSKVLDEKREAPPKILVYPPPVEATTGQSASQKTGGHGPQAGGHALETASREPQVGGHEPQVGGHALETGGVHSTVPSVFPSGFPSAETYKLPTHQQQQNDAVDGNANNFKTASEPPAPQIQESLIVTAPLVNEKELSVSHQLARRLVDLGIPKDWAAHLVAEWPEVTAADAELVERLSDMGIEPARRTGPATLVAAHGESVRWQLVLWSHRAQATSETMGNKPGFFVACVRDDREPPRGFVQYLQAKIQRIELQHRVEQQKAATVAARAEANEFIASLTDTQRRHLENDLRKEMSAKHKNTGQWFSMDSPEADDMRVQLLSLPNTRTWLLSIEDDAKPIVDKATPAADAPTGYVPHPSDQQRSVRYISKIVSSVKAGDVAIDDVLKECQQAPGFPTKHYAWMADAVRALLVDATEAAA